MSMLWATVTVFESLVLAEIARGRLQLEGIPCLLLDRSLLQLGIVAEGIKLQVNFDDLERAQAILAADYSGELE